MVQRVYVAGFVQAETRRAFIWYIRLCISVFAVIRVNSGEGIMHAVRIPVCTSHGSISQLWMLRTTYRDKQRPLYTPFTIDVSPVVTRKSREKWIYVTKHVGRAELPKATTGSNNKGVSTCVACISVTRMDNDGQINRRVFTNPPNV